MAKRLCSSYRNWPLHKPLKNFANDNTIKICKFNEVKRHRNSCSSDYYLKLDFIVCDQSRFVQVNQNTKVHSVIS